MLPSTLPKSISLPQIRSDRKLLRSDKSARSIGAGYALANDEDVGDSSADDHETKVDSAKSGRRVRFSDNLSPAVCRICHGGEASCPFGGGEPLIAPCLCTGSMGLYHRGCLEKWLSISNSEKCEICKFQYAVERRPKSVVEFIRNPGSRAIHRNMFGDLMCFCILTPMAMASCWLCIAGALAVAGSGSDAIAVPGLASLAVFLVLTYVVWLLISLRYHIQVWRDWRLSNQTVRLIKGRCDSIVDEHDDNNNDVGNQVVLLELLAEVPSRRSTDTNANHRETLRHEEEQASSAILTFEYPNPAFMWETIV